MNVHKLLKIIDKTYEDTGIIPYFVSADSLVKFLMENSSEGEYRNVTFAKNVDIDELNNTIDYMFGC